MKLKKPIDLKQPVSILKLITSSFSTAYHLWGTVIFLSILVGILDILLIGGVYLTVVLPMLSNPFALFASIKTVAIVVLSVAAIMMLLYYMRLSAVCKLVAAEVRGKMIAVTEAFTSSFLPGVYLLVSILLLQVVYHLLLLGLKMTPSATVYIVGFICLVIGMLPFIFLLPAISVAEQGPVAAARYSWQLVSKYIGKALLLLLVLILFSVILFVGGVLVFLLISFVAPQLFASLQTFLQHPSSSLGVFAGFSVISLIIASYLVTFFTSLVTILFLNLDTLQGSTQVQEEETLTLAQESALPLQDLTEPMDIKQASVSTEQDEHTIGQLDQVYNAQDHLSKEPTPEEDRMPTILFDDTMNQQLEESERRMLQQQENANKPKEDEGPQSIKISDKPL